jgi:FdhD protein
MARAASTVTARVRTVEDGTSRQREDRLAVEEPLEIRLVGSDGRRVTAATTMRTPGNDFELAAGLLYAEGLLAGKDHLRTIRYCRDAELDGAQEYNIVTVEVAGAAPAVAIQQNLSATSACGLCGRATVDLLAERAVPLADPGRPVVTPALIATLPGVLATGQRRQAETGGAHAAGLFDADGNLLCVREDVGRHNAVDKVVGWALLEGGLPLHDRLLMVSGRASFEIVQKAVVAGIPVVCAVSAPSSLAVDTARRFGVTLAGFVRGERFNLYAGEERVQAE